MSLKDQLNNDLKTAMKARDVKKVGVLRMVLSEIKYAQSAVNIHQELDDAAVLKVIVSYHKKLLKAADEFPDVEKKSEIMNEVNIVAAYLPKKADAGETQTAIDDVLASTTERAFGPLMKQVLVRLGDAADGKLVSELLKKAIDSK